MLKGNKVKLNLDPQPGTSTDLKKSRTIQDGLTIGQTNKNSTNSEITETGKLLPPKQQMITVKKQDRKCQKTGINSRTTLNLCKKGEITKVPRSSLTKAMTVGKMNNKVIPIIQTRGMKAKENLGHERSLTNDEIQNLVNLDNLNDAEFFAADEVCHDGIELSVPGDMEDFPPEDQGQTEPEPERQSQREDSDHNEQSDQEQESLFEPGEIASDDESDLEPGQPPRMQIPSKVIKVNNSNRLPRIPKRFQSLKIS